jgi:hypothetical protein
VEAQEKSIRGGFKQGKGTNLLCARGLDGLRLGFEKAERGQLRDKYVSV